MIAENDARPEGERLARSHFDIDPELRDMIEAEIQEAEKNAHEEMRWETEKQRVALAKLKGVPPFCSASWRECVGTRVISWTGNHTPHFAGLIASVDF